VSNFAAMMGRIAAKGVRGANVETANCLTCDLIVQETGQTHPAGAQDREFERAMVISKLKGFGSASGRRREG
jgi:hypothetical protein